MLMNIYNWHKLCKMCAKCILKGIVNKIMHAKVKMYVIRNSCVALNARPFVLTL